MDTLINVVRPVFALILTGYLAGRFEVLGPESAAALTRFVFYFAFPAALFVFSARAPIAKTFNWPFISAFVCASLLTLFVALMVERLCVRHDIAPLSVVGFTQWPPRPRSNPKEIDLVIGAIVVRALQHRRGPGLFRARHEAQVLRSLAVTPGIGAPADTDLGPQELGARP